jgi:hypothetical protein
MRNGKFGFSAAGALVLALLLAADVKAGCGGGGCGGWSNSYGGGCYSGGCYSGGCYSGGCYSGGCYSGGYSGGCSSGSCALPTSGGYAYRVRSSHAPTYAYQSAPRSISRAPKFQYAFGLTPSRATLVRSTPSNRVAVTSTAQR